MKYIFEKKNKNGFKTEFDNLPFNPLENSPLGVPNPAEPSKKLYDILTKK